MIPLRLMVLALLAFLAGGAAAAAADREGVIVVIDASSSMWAPVEGRPKIEIAREALHALIAGWNADADLGLVAYGHRRQADCTDIEYLLPIGPVDEPRITGLVDSLTPAGKTPLTAAVRQAAEILGYAERPATVVLFSDGLETCNADPCALAAELERTGVRFTAHVVGFDVAADERQLACLAEATGGLYLAADGADQLMRALETVGRVAADPAMGGLITLEAVGADGAVIGDGVTWTVVSLDSEDGAPVSAGVARPALPLEPGTWRAEASAGGASGAEQFVVAEGIAATIRVVIAGEARAAPTTPVAPAKPIAAAPQGPAPGKPRGAAPQPAIPPVVGSQDAGAAPGEEASPAAGEEASEEEAAGEAVQFAWLELPAPTATGGTQAPANPFADAFWTRWFNLDVPEDGGDREELAEFVQRGWVCAAPAAVECRTFDGRPWQAAGQAYVCEPAKGGLCADADQPAGQPCLDYEVRFRCQ